MGGYLGVMAKLGPFCSMDNCSLVRGVLDKLITHLLVQSVHVWLWLEGGSPNAELECVVLLEGVGAMGVAGTVVGLEVVVEVLEKTGWHILVSAQGVLVVDIVEICCMPVEIMMVSMTFKIKSFKLIDVFCFNFAMSVVLHFVDE